MQERGFNGFSYADVADDIGVTKAGLHYHFASKAELGEALIARYAERFSAALAGVDAGAGDARVKLDAYAALYADVLRAERMCLCGMLAAEYGTLPAPMQAAVLRFFDENETWLEELLLARQEGRDAAVQRLGAGDGPVDHQRARGRDARRASVRRRRALPGRRRRTAREPRGRLDVAAQTA